MSEVKPPSPVPAPEPKPYAVTVTIRKNGNVIREFRLVDAAIKAETIFAQDGDQMIVGQFAGKPEPDPFDAPGGWWALA